MPFDNLDDISKLLYGTCSFMFDGVAHIADIQKIDYVPAGAGAIHLHLVDIRIVVGGKVVMREASYQIPLFLADVSNKPRELIVNQAVKHPRFGQIFSFRCRDPQ